jgi:CHASE3 domain sensor protein
MTQDFSYMNEQPSEAQEQAIQEAITRECMKAIILYLEEVAETMDKQGIETLNVPTLRAMAQELRNKNINNVD